MTFVSVKKLRKSVLRIAVALTVILGIPAIVYWCWQPGSNAPLPEYSNNAIWIGHGWLGNDAWFSRNHRNPADFRSKEKITELFQKLRKHHIAIVFPHLCPAQYCGAIAPYDDTQIERFLDLAAQYQIKVIPWIGGVFEDSARPAEQVWRKNFIDSVAELLKKHPRLSGVQVNIEPLPCGNMDFIQLLNDLRTVMPAKLLSVAAYPPPTQWQPSDLVHWQGFYIHTVARYCDQMAVMMYDTAIPLEKFYIQLMTRWTTYLIGIMDGEYCELLLGVPAYDDAGTGYHHPQVENLSSALRGISASSRTIRCGGIALYCEWEMDNDKWREWRKFIR